ncbi:PepSY-associated TM helix domain-containing protein [Nocardia alni]|uniref:PepSY-associated TM helix domain-containing protein n=1 Tax=Nocardia alni TaxID=2815723 RepID=UPI001C22BB62|nr:PepSY-associated TM helix domain-containing protein [Nocardia alni]
MSITELPVSSSTPPPARPPTRGTLYALAMRLHFYAGVFVAPFILIAAITGALYSIAPTVESIVDRNLLHVDSTGPARPLSDQVAAATAIEPNLVLAAVDPAPKPGDTTEVLFADSSLGESEHRAVFVNPVTARPVGASVVYGSTNSLPLRSWLDQLHRDLHLGQTGRLYSELAASWLWLIALAGVAVWGKRVLDRRDGVATRRLLWPDRSRTGRGRTLSWHAAVGMWILLPLLFLSATGMTWSTYAGAHVDTLRRQLDWQAPAVGTTLPGSRAPHGDSQMMPGMDMPMPGSDSMRQYRMPADRVTQVDKVFAAARGHGVDGPVEITVPATDDTAFVVKERRIPGSPTQDSIAIDGRTGNVTDVLRYSSWPFMAKLANWGIALHMGMLFGLPNQLLLLVTMIALITVIVRGYLMWWKRGPVRASRFAFGTPPLRGMLRRLPPVVLVPSIAAAALIGWFAPLLGVTLVCFLAIDIMIGLAQSRRGRPA